MRKSPFGLCVCLCLGGCLAVAAFAQNPNEKYLTGADVDRVAGMKGVKLIPRMSVPGAGGDLNFADAAGELILMVQITDARNFDGFKKKYEKAAIAGVGDQAFQGAIMPGMPDNLLAFTKGSRCCVLTAFGDFAKNRIYLKIDQLAALAKVIASRV